MPLKKSQWRTQEKVGRFLPKNLISHCQLDVAMSRVGARNRICVQVVGGGKAMLFSTAILSTQKFFYELQFSCPLLSVAFSLWPPQSLHWFLVCVAMQM